MNTKTILWIAAGIVALVWLRRRGYLGGVVTMPVGANGPGNAAEIGRVSRPTGGFVPDIYRVNERGERILDPGSPPVLGVFAGR